MTLMRSDHNGGRGVTTDLGEKAKAGLVEEARWLLRIGAAVAGLMAGGSAVDLFGGKGRGGSDHAQLPGHPVVMEKVWNLHTQLVRIERKLDEALGR